MKLRRTALAFILVLTSPVLARDALGIFGTWGAFRDAEPERCFAIAEPIEPSSGKWKPFVSVSHWPKQSIRGQLHVRLSRERSEDKFVYLTIDDRRWRLTAGKADAWSLSAAHDAYIIARMRAGRSMSISTVAATGGGFADTYSLKGAATAIDAAALGCAAPR
jgi:hypothetical protein